MRAGRGERRRAITGRHKAGELGFTLIEVLVSLAILSLLVGFIAGGFTMARRAVNADLNEESASSTDGAIETLCSLIASALPLSDGGGNRKSGLLFEGRQDRLVFVGLSEGHSVRGGPHKIALSLSGSNLVVDVRGWPEAAAGPGSGAAPTPVVALRGVRLLRFGYYGTSDAAVAPGWWGDWVVVQRLPQLISIQVEFQDLRRNQPPRVIALRQG